MTEKEIFESLCFYDERSPYYNKEWQTLAKPCNCNNCFRGRHKLAAALLESRKENSKQISFMKNTAHALNILKLNIKQYYGDFDK